MHIKLPNIDLVSFWAGFVLATIFWLVLLRISKLLPKMRKSAAEARLIQQQKRDLDREHGLRTYALRKAESSHLASSLFPLSSILIQPTVLTPSRFLPKANEEFATNTIYRVLPDMPEVPELVAEFPTVKNSLFTLIEAGQQYIGVSAEPGQGKTTALAALTSELCTKQDKTQRMSYLPIFFDYLEIEASGGLAADDLIQYLHTALKNITEQTLKELLDHANVNNRLVLIIDGLDRLPIEELSQATHWLQDLKTIFPQARMVVACDPFVLGGIPDLGFEVFALSAWNHNEKRHFLSLWKNAWFTLKLDDSQKQTLERTIRWLVQEESADTPLEITIRNWSALAGIAEKAEEKNLYPAWLKLCSGDWLNDPTAEILVQEADLLPYPHLSIEKALQIIESSLNEKSTSVATDLISRKAESAIPTAQAILDLLIENHFLSKIAEEKLLLSSLSAFAFYRSRLADSAPLPEFESVMESPAARKLFETRLISQADAFSIDGWLDRADHPLRRDHLIALHWLQHTEKGDPLREKFFRQTAKLLQEKTLPVGLRYRFVLPLIRTGDPSISALFAYFGTSPDVSLRQISALALGFFKDDKTIGQLVKLSRDSELEVQKIACLSLDRIWTQPTQSALIDAVFTGEDNLRAMICELFSLHVPEGHQILQELTGTDNYLARRAAIYGLVHIQEPWVNTLLEKLSIEDTQWIVRDAAKFALEHPFAPSTFIAQKEIPVLENPWTLQKAEANVTVLPAQGLPENLLFTILDKDTLPNKEIALHYLQNQPTPRLISKLTSFCADPQSDFRETALNTLFSLSKRGFDIQTKNE